MLQIKIMNCRSKLMSVLFKQNTIALPFKDPLQRVQSNVIFYNSFHSGRKNGQSLALKLKKLKQKVTFLTQDVTIHKPSQRACNQDVTTLKQGVTIVPRDVTTLEQEVTKNIQYMIIHRRIPTIFKKDNTNQNAGLEKRRTNQGIGANRRRLLTI